MFNFSYNNNMILYKKNIFFSILIILIIIIFVFILIGSNKNIIEKYSDSVNNKMKKYNVIFAGTCRNVESYIKKVIEHIDDCGEKFNSYYLILYENDSTDKTREILEKNKKSNYFYIFEDNIKEARRTVRLERGRNLILDKIREINKDNHYQYLIIIDLDNVNRNGTFVKTINNCFDNEDWDVISANQKKRYYDTYALRYKDLTYDCSAKRPVDGKRCGKIKIKFPPNKRIDVDSAFGGTTIYKLSSIPNHCKYNGKYDDGDEKCEHVDFNKCIKDSGKKIIIDTNFINDG